MRLEYCPPLRVGACRDGSPPCHRFHNADDCHSPLSQSRPLSQPEIVFDASSTGLHCCCWGRGLYGGLETPGAGDGSLLRQLLEAAAASAAARRREGGREGYVTAKQNTDTAACPDKTTAAWIGSYLKSPYTTCVTQVLQMFY